ncbi:MAG: SpoIIE family protein phosphatase [Solirubrobacteraceae bacterium]
MSGAAAPGEQSTEELFEDAPCGFLACELDGTITRVNRTFERWTGRPRAELLGRRFPDLLTAAGRIYYETHYTPLLRVNGSVREIALELVAGDGSRLPSLINSTLKLDAAGRPHSIRTAVFDVSDRRRYERELLDARRREQQIAQELQRSLLAGELPVSPAFDVEVLYRPAVAGLDVGGDWYDAFWLSADSVALGVGDVVGRGITAAATMGQLRSAIRALASTGLGPAQLLDALDRYAERHEIGRMTTAIYAELRPASGELRYSSAGHPPAVLTTPDGTVSLLSGGRSTPIDAVAHPDRRPQDVVALQPGSRLLLFSDGLVERRDRSFDAGLAELLSQVQEMGNDLSLLALARRLEDRAHPDDVCLLSVRLT